MKPAQPKDQYITQIVSEKAPKDLEPHELRALAKLKATAAIIEHSEGRLAAMRNEMERLEVEIVTNRGKANALAELLWAEHLELRGEGAAKSTEANGEAKAEPAPAPVTPSA